MVAIRTSSLVPRDGIPIATKAANRVRALNNSLGTSSQIPFTILNNTSSDALQKVIFDLDLKVEDVDEQLNVFRAEEVARAAIDEANYKSFLEKQRSKDAPQDEEQLSDLTMEVITNSQRDLPQSSLMGESKDKEVGAEEESSSIQVSHEDIILECQRLGKIQQKEIS
jgi:hypothetical protein